MKTPVTSLDFSCLGFVQRNGIIFTPLSANGDPSVYEQHVDETPIN